MGKQVNSLGQIWPPSFKAKRLPKALEIYETNLENQKRPIASF
jgi:hypothetical protein